MPQKRHLRPTDSPPLTTQTIGIKEFRQNLKKLATLAAGESKRFIVMRRNTPLGEWRPITDNKQLLDELAAEIAASRKESPKEMERILRLGLLHSDLRQASRNHARGAAR